jgi:hypothetical protein
VPIHMTRKGVSQEFLSHSAIIVNVSSYCGFRAIDAGNVSYGSQPGDGIAPQLW